MSESADTDTSQILTIETDSTVPPDGLDLELNGTTETTNDPNP